MMRLPKATFFLSSSRSFLPTFTWLPFPVDIIRMPAGQARWRLSDDLFGVPIAQGSSSSIGPGKPAPCARATGLLESYYRESALYLLWFFRALILAR